MVISILVSNITQLKTWFKHAWLDTIIKFVLEVAF